MEHSLRENDQIKQVEKVYAGFDQLGGVKWTKFPARDDTHFSQSESRTVSSRRVDQ